MLLFLYCPKQNRKLSQKKKGQNCKSNGDNYVISTNPNSPSAKQLLGNINDQSFVQAKFGGAEK